MHRPTKAKALIQDPEFIFVILVFPWPLNKTRRLHKTRHNLRQYGVLFWVNPEEVSHWRNT